MKFAAGEILPVDFFCSFFRADEQFWRTAQLCLAVRQNLNRKRRLPETVFPVQHGVHIRTGIPNWYPWCRHTVIRHKTFLVRSQIRNGEPHGMFPRQLFAVQLYDCFIFPGDKLRLQRQGDSHFRLRRNEIRRADCLAFRSFQQNGSADLFFRRQCGKRLVKAAE